MISKPTLVVSCHQLFPYDHSWLGGGSGERMSAPISLLHLLGFFSMSSPASGLLFTISRILIFLKALKTKYLRIIKPRARKLVVKWIIIEILSSKRIVIESQNLY